MSVKTVADLKDRSLDCRKHGDAGAVTRSPQQPDLPYFVNAKAIGRVVFGDTVSAAWVRANCPKHVFGHRTVLFKVDDVIENVPVAGRGSTIIDDLDQRICDWKRLVGDVEGDK